MIFNAMGIEDITQGEGADRDETPRTSAEALQNLILEKKRSFQNRLKGSSQRYRIFFLMYSDTEAEIEDCWGENTELC